MTQPFGYCAPEFAAVHDLVAANLASGEEAGFALCVVRDGERVVDLWGGIADHERGTAWEANTLVNCFSVTKTMVAIVALLLVEGGQLVLDAPVAHYWPAFAANGKSGVLVRHLLNHSSGVAGWEKPLTVEDLYDLDRSSALLAEQAPWWSPGTQSGYEAQNYGHLLNPVVEAITGRTLGQYFAEEIAQPLNADFFIGTPTAEHERIARLIAPPSTPVDYSAIDSTGVMSKALTNPAFPITQTASSAWRTSEIGAANGHGSARGVAAVQSLVSHGGTACGRTVLSSGTIADVFANSGPAGLDRVLMMPLHFGLGYALSPPTVASAMPDGRVCWWTGYGGSLVINDLDRRLTLAYVMNKMAPSIIGSPRSDGYLRAVYDSLDD